MQALESQSMFSVLTKYTQRQGENTLTQAFIAMFNHSLVFRQIFQNIIADKQMTRCEGSPANLYAVSQILRKPTSTRRLIADAEIRKKQDNCRIATIEVKLSATLTYKQAAGYSKLLKYRKKGALMVMLTKYGVDPELALKLPKKTVWISWSELAEALHEAKNGTNVERFLRKEFLHMLQEKEIPMLPAVTAKGWSRMGLINNFILYKKAPGLHFEAIKAAKTIMDRFAVLRDEAWSELAQKGWKPYNRIYRREENDKEYVAIECGYFIWKPKRSIKERDIALELRCGYIPRISIYGGWDLRESHSSYEDEEWCPYFHKWTPSQSRKMICCSFGDIFEDTVSQMRKTLKKFQRSRFYLK